MLLQKAMPQKAPWLSQVLSLMTISGFAGQLTWNRLCIIDNLKLIDARSELQELMSSHFHAWQCCQMASSFKSKLSIRGRPNFHVVPSEEN